MKIVLVVPFISLEPLRGYEKIALEHFKEFSKLKYTIHVVSLESDNQRIFKVDDFTSSNSRGIAIKNRLFTRLKNLTLYFIQKKPLQFGYFRGYINSLEKQSLLDQYDLLIGFTSRSAEFSLEITAKKKVIHLVDPLSLSYSRSISWEGGIRKWINKIEAPRLIAAEKKLLSNFDIVTLISDNDIDDYKKLLPEISIEKFQYGINPSNIQKVNNKINLNKMVISGNMSYSPNIKGVLWFVHSILPKLRIVYPELELFIVGALPDKRLLSLENDYVHITGYVRNLEEFISDSLCSICPILHDIGIQTKILEAMNSKIPVISTSIGNNGVMAIPGEQILIADTSEEFIQAIRRLKNSKKRSELVSNAHLLIHEKFNLKSNTRKFLKRIL